MCWSDLNENYSAHICIMAPAISLIVHNNSAQKIKASVYKDIMTSSHSYK